MGHRSLAIGVRTSVGTHGRAPLRGLACSITRCISYIALIGSSHCLLQADAGADFLHALRREDSKQARAIFVEHQNEATKAFEKALVEAPPQLAGKYRAAVRTLQPQLKNFALSEICDLDRTILATLYADKQRGWEAWRRNRFEEARDQFRKALETAEVQSWRWQQQHLLFLIAYTLFDERRFGESDRWLESAWRIRDSRRPSHLDAMIQEDLGHNAQKQGEPYRALQHHHQALELHTALEYSEGIAGASNNLGTLYHECENYSAALTYYRRCLSALPSSNPNVPIVENNIADCLLYLHRTDEASPILFKPLDRGSTAYFDRLSLHQKYLRFSGKKIEAAALSRVALQQVLAARNWSCVRDALVDVIENVDDGNEAFQLVRKFSSLLPAADPDRWYIDFLLAERYRRNGALKRAEEFAQSAFSRVRQRGLGPDFEFNFSARLLEAARLWVSILSERERSFRALHVWEMAKSFVHGKVPPDLYAFQQSMGPNCAAVDFCVADNETIVWIIRRQSVDCVVLKNPASKLADQITSLRAPLVSPLNLLAPPNPHKAATELYRALIQPLDALLRGTNCWTVLRDRNLHSIPFELLEAGDGKSLLERAVIRYWDTLHSFQGAPRTLRKFTVWVDGTSNDYSLLPAGTQIARNWEDARRSQGDVLHYGGHSVLDENFPAVSSLASSGEGITARQIARSKLSYRLVVLSSCDSAGGVSGFGSGLTGLSTAFQHAGAPQVIATLWPIDHHSSLLLSEFYRPPLREEELAQSFRRVRLRFRRKTYVVGSYKLSMSSPYFWAPFILMAPHSPHPPTRHSELISFLLPLALLTTKYCVRRRYRPKG